MRAFFTAFWVERKSVQNPDIMILILENALGKKITEDIMAKSDSIQVKNILRKNTKECFDSGSFGLPWIIATNCNGKQDTFWGFDRLGFVAEHLGFDDILLNNESGKKWWSPSL